MEIHFARSDDSIREKNPFNTLPDFKPRCHF